jgi:hypothetical protein
MTSPNAQYSSKDAQPTSMDMLATAPRQLPIANYKLLNRKENWKGYGPPAYSSNLACMSLEPLIKLLSSKHRSFARARSSPWQMDPLICGRVLMQLLCLLMPKPCTSSGFARSAAGRYKMYDDPTLYKGSRHRCWISSSCCCAAGPTP